MESPPSSGRPARESKQLFEVSIERDGAARPITGGATLAGSFALSHDGRTIVASTSEGIILVPLERSEPRPLGGSLHGDIPLEWSGDNQSLFLSERGQASLKVFRIDIESGERHEWLPIRPDDPAGILDIMPVHITPDGKTYALRLPPPALRSLHRHRPALIG